MTVYLLTLSNSKLNNSVDLNELASLCSEDCQIELGRMNLTALFTFPSQKLQKIALWDLSPACIDYLDALVLHPTYPYYYLFKGEIVIVCESN